MRILHLVHQYAPDHVGGTELYTQTVARHQVEMGHETAVFYPSPIPGTNTPFAATNEAGVLVYRLPVGPRSRLQVFRNTFGQKQIEQAFRFVLAQAKPDIVHIQHLMGLPANLVNQIITAGLPFIITLHDYWYGCANAQLLTNYDNTNCAGPDTYYGNCARCALARIGHSKTFLTAPILVPLMAARNNLLRRILAQAHTVIAPTQFVYNMYQQMGLPTENFTVIAHGIEIPQAVAALRRQPRYKQDPTNGDILQIGYVGSLGWQKGVHVLITAVNGLPHDNVSLTLYGDTDTFPEYVTQLRQTVQHPGIHFAGRVSRDDLWESLARLDVVVMPTLWYEASPLIIQEVFAAGVPLIASKIGAMIEKIDDGINGLLVPPDDANALRNTLQRFLQEPDLRQKLQAGIKPVRTIQEQLVEIEAVYKTATTNAI